MQAAMDYLTRPNLTPTFSDQILVALIRNAQDDDSSLALEYYHTVLPPLSSQTTLETFFSYLAGISVTEAYQFAHGRSEDAHRQLFELLLHEALSAHTGDRRAVKGVELIDLPFTDVENAWFEQYLLDGKGSTLHGARDAVMTRRLASGKLEDAIKDGRHFTGRKHDSMSWEAAKDGLEKGLGPRRDCGYFTVGAG
jgi:hypothetical protein